MHRDTAQHNTLGRLELSAEWCNGQPNAEKCHGLHTRSCFAAASSLKRLPLLLNTGWGQAAAPRGPNVLLLRLLRLRRGPCLRRGWRHRLPNSALPLVALVAADARDLVAADVARRRRELHSRQTIHEAEVPSRHSTHGLDLRPLPGLALGLALGLVLALGLAPVVLLL